MDEQWITREEPWGGEKWCNNACKQINKDNVWCAVMGGCSGKDSMRWEEIQKLQKHVEDKQWDVIIK